VGEGILEDDISLGRKMLKEGQEGAAIKVEHREGY